LKLKPADESIEVTEGDKSALDNVGESKFWDEGEVIVSKFYQVHSASENKFIQIKSDEKNLFLKNESDGEALDEEVDLKINFEGEDKPADESIEVTEGNKNALDDVGESKFRDEGTCSKKYYMYKPKNIVKKIL